jgi:hypothetical protein
MKTAYDDMLTENPLLTELSNKARGELLTFWGYIGPARDKATIALYPNLKNTSDYVEIAKADIVHVADVPENVLLFGGKVVWVRTDAEVARRQASSTDALRKMTTQGPAETGNTAADMKAGRLRMTAPAEMARSDCHSPCATCRDCSSVCICICRYTDPPA